VALPQTAVAIVWLRSAFGISRAIPGHVLAIRQRYQGDCNQRPVSVNSSRPKFMDRHAPDFRGTVAPENSADKRATHSQERREHRHRRERKTPNTKRADSGLFQPALVGKVRNITTFRVSRSASGATAATVPKIPLILAQTRSRPEAAPMVPPQTAVAIASLRLAYSSIRSCIAALADHAKATAFWGQCERVAPFPSVSLTARGASRDSRRYQRLRPAIRSTIPLGLVPESPLNSGAVI
jgi:hypothetical protein